MQQLAHGRLRPERLPIARSRAVSCVSRRQHHNRVPEIDALIAKGLLPPDTPSTDFHKEAGR